MIWDSLRISVYLVGKLALQRGRCSILGNRTANSREMNYAECYNTMSFLIESDMQQSRNLFGPFEMNVVTTIHLHNIPQTPIESSEVLPRLLSYEL